MDNHKEIKIVDRVYNVGSSPIIAKPSISITYDAEFGNSIEIVGDKKTLRIFVQPDYENNPQVLVSLENR